MAFGKTGSAIIDGGQCSRASVNQTSNVSVTDFLRGFEPPLRQLAESASERILWAVPHARRVRLGWRLIGYNAPADFAFSNSPNAPGTSPTACRKMTTSVSRLLPSAARA